MPTASAMSRVEVPLKPWSRNSRAATRIKSARRLDASPFAVTRDAARGLARGLVRGRALGLARWSAVVRRAGIGRAGGSFETKQLLAWPRRIQLHARPRAQIASSQ